MQKGAKDLLAPWQLFEDVGRGERNMEEEAGATGAAGFP